MKQTINPSEWRIGTVTQIIPEAAALRSYAFRFDTPVKHDAGQHYELRLTAEDGYQAVRLYSAAMPANGTANVLQLTVALMPQGEVSPYLFNQVTVGSKLEIRGPFGRHFIWTPEVEDPILMVGGGSGIVPLRAIRLMRQQMCCEPPMRLIYSVKSYQDMPYKYELFPQTGIPPEDVLITFTDDAPTGWRGYTRRIDEAMVREVLQSLPNNPAVYICGPTFMVESVSFALEQAGVDPAKIKAERFGPTA